MQLADGKPIESSSKRIDAAKKFLEEFEIQIGGPTVALLEQLDAGTLTPASTELLAHLLGAQVSKARAALEN